MKQYVLAIAVLTLGISALVGTFNYLVDPYALYNFNDVREEQLSRVDQFHYMRITKPWHLRQLKPSAVIVGSSRTARVPPGNAVWADDTSYNMSIPGMTVYEMSRFIEHAQALQPLNKLMIGLDFDVFIRPDPEFRTSFEESRLLSTSDDLTSSRFVLHSLSDVADSLLSLPSFVKSLSAVVGSNTLGRRYYKDGTWIQTTKALTGRGGYIYIGSQAIVEVNKLQLGLNVNFERFAEALRFAHQHDIETRLFITPEHVFMIDLWWRLGRRELWVEFHRKLIETNNAVAAELDKKPFPIIGFNHLSGVVDEPIQKVRRNADSNFKDGLHFRKPLGRKIMNAVWSDDDALGARLDSESLNAYLDEIASLQRGFESENSNLTGLLRSNISPTLNQ